MTDFNLELSPDLESRLMDEASRQGVSVDSYAQSLLEQHLPNRTKQEQAIALLQSWIDDDEDAEEQAETMEHLIQALDDDRLSNRPLFPPELKGKIW
jgi:Spy/CpxP family protein refolding chaperone